MLTSIDWKFQPLIPLPPHHEYGSVGGGHHFRGKVRYPKVANILDSSRHISNPIIILDLSKINLSHLNTYSVNVGETTH